MFNLKLISKTEIEQLQQLFANQKAQLDSINEAFALKCQECEDLKQQIEKRPTPGDAFKEILGLPVLRFDNVDEEGMPPHYLNVLDESSRKTFVSEMENIYQSPRFRSLINYIINMLGNTGIRSSDKDSVRNGAIAVISVGMVYKELDNMHREFLSYSKREETFDDQDILPE